MVIFGVERFCHHQTKGFAISKVVSDLTFNPEWEVPSLSEKDQSELDLILNQKFTFLDSGGSFYTFESPDQKYVLKLFKMHHLNPFPWLTSSPLSPLYQPLIEKLRAKQNKLRFVFNSCKIAYHELRDETGVIYLHLNKTKKLHKNALIVDNLGIEHSIDLNRMEFIVQKRAKLACEYIAELMHSQGPEMAKEALSSVWQLMQTIMHKGLDDHDMNIETNFGFVDGKPIKIDVGPFKKDERMKIPDFFNKRLSKPAKRFDRWLKNNQPELYDHFNQLVQNSPLI